MIHKTSILLPFLMILSATVSAQDTAPRDKGVQGFVRFSIECEVMASSEAYTNIPADILDKLVQYPSLVRVDLDKMNSNSKNYHLRAGFIFRDLQNFREWYQSDEVKQLLENLEKENPSVYGIELDVHRSPQRRFLKPSQEE